MKTVKLFIAIALFVAVGANVSDQTGTKAVVAQKTDTLKVWGKCDMCKTRIEKTVKNEGVTSATWDQKTQMRAVTYDPAK